jgi:hypothetical protein
MRIENQRGLLPLVRSGIEEAIAASGVKAFVIYYMTMVSGARG